jgi:hypothetical protein
MPMERSTYRNSMPLPAAGASTSGMSI